MRTLVLGGGRSGKSGFAEQLAGVAPPVRYLATAFVDPADADFAERVALHRARRPADWTTVEPGDDLSGLIARGACGTTLVDDLGTWLTARLDARGGWDGPPGAVAPDADALVDAVRAATGRLILVSPEVGLGVLPATRSGRVFRDELGTLNQRLAAVVDEVFFVIAGLPTRVK
jgi:adenosyl cobinamide kinase/adenosyl cobinamide phosphate guanylyltransferase